MPARTLGVLLAAVGFVLAVALMLTSRQTGFGTVQMIGSVVGVALLAAGAVIYVRARRAAAPPSA